MQYFTVLAFLAISFTGTPVESILRDPMVRFSILAILCNTLAFVLGALLFSYYLLASLAPLAFNAIASVLAMIYWRLWRYAENTMKERDSNASEQATAHEPASTAVLTRAPTLIQHYYGPNPLKPTQAIPVLILGRYSVQDVLSAYVNSYYPIHSLSSIVIDISVGSQIVYNATIGGALHSVIVRKNAHYVDTTRQLISTSTPTSSVVDASEDGDATLVDIDMALCESVDSQSTDPVQDKTLLNIDTTVSPAGIKPQSASVMPTAPTASSESRKAASAFAPGSRLRLLNTALAPIRAVASSSAKTKKADDAEVAAATKMTPTLAASSLVELTRKAIARAGRSRQTASSPTTACTPETSASGSASSSEGAPSETTEKRKKRRGGKRLPMPIRRQRKREREAAAVAAAAA
ncbi:hypothetical protein L226DRAFT_562020 [Lentinus tigrinus ALCF2SS1-7]|uniref:Uncharacterized protein n=1 Tax=Lentinus tigrinus ALCF2SS1-6 TaxID=1328759 RepID=A0A5C2S1V5_9APHY|nr:hypothetical protein L227DRAFT_655545 [Lentinus tigrinus ALCF2SS1-6]RPD72075.1 hypothetical protein L226DRAFT_562020 [Lentinus tigrinus ALCF2SS1-7]